MKPVIYIDTLFLINFIFNMLIFYMSAYILRKEIKALRIFLVSALASLYGVLMFFPDFSIFYTGVSKILFMVLFSKLLFSSHTLKMLIKESLVCFSVSVGFCGSLCALLTLTNTAPKLGMIISGGVLYLDIDPLILLFGIGISVIILIFFASSCHEESENKELIREFIITAENESFKVRALVDTGCSLFDLSGSLPAIIVESGLFPKTKDKVFLSCSSVMRENESLEAFVPQRVTDIDKKILYKAIIAQGKESFDKKGRFNAVVNPAIFKNAERMEHEKTV